MLHNESRAEEIFYAWCAEYWKHARQSGEGFPEVQYLGHVKFEWTLELLFQC